MKIDSSSPSLNPIKEPFYKTPVGKAVLTVAALTAIGALAYWFSSTSLTSRPSTPLKDGEIPIPPGFDQCKIQGGGVRCTGPEKSMILHNVPDLETFIETMKERQEFQKYFECALAPDDDPLDRLEYLAKLYQNSEGGSAGLFAMHTYCGRPQNERYFEILHKYFSDGPKPVDPTACVSCTVTMK